MAQSKIKFSQALKEQLKVDLKKARLKTADYKLILVDSTSYKYYRIEYYREWSRYIFAYGKIGTAGVEGMKEFRTPAEAVKEAKILYNSKLKKGYVNEADYFKKPLKKTFSCSKEKSY